ncbi:MAG: hypothetical protein ABSC73_02620 [Acidimicrobiales bacterium]|jgi:hypothetical protein
MGTEVAAHPARRQGTQAGRVGWTAAVGDPAGESGREQVSGTCQVGHLADLAGGYVDQPGRPERGDLDPARRVPYPAA